MSLILRDLGYYRITDVFHDILEILILAPARDLLLC